MGKNGFLATKNFSAKRKNGRFSVILARTRSVVIVGHFLMAQTFPPSFVGDGPKLRVPILAKWEWPKIIGKIKVILLITVESAYTENKPMQRCMSYLSFLRVLITY